MRRRWISEKRFLHALNYCMVLPGPEAQQLATYIGWLLHKTRGGIVAGALFVLPSLFILIALTWVYIAFGEVPLIAGIFYGIKPAVTAIVVHAAHRIGSRVLKNNALWATATQMIDGLALGETTPGPLIMVVAFVGFIGGYVKEVLGPQSLFLAGAVAASLVAWFTFLPSFLFILAGGPLVDSTHNDLKFTAPLTAITAAVVGVILNLAMFFGYHVLWPQGFGGAFDLPSAVIALAAAVALFKYQRNVIHARVYFLLTQLGYPHQINF